MPKERCRAEASRVRLARGDWASHWAAGEPARTTAASVSAVMRSSWAAVYGAASACCMALERVGMAWASGG